MTQLWWMCWNAYRGWNDPYNEVCPHFPPFQAKIPGPGARNPDPEFWGRWAAEICAHWSEWTSHKKHLCSLDIIWLTGMKNLCTLIKGLKKMGAHWSMTLKKTVCTLGEDPEKRCALWSMTLTKSVHSGRWPNVQSAHFAMSTPVCTFCTPVHRPPHWCLHLLPDFDAMSNLSWIIQQLS
jgi:hypothetical protein